MAERADSKSKKPSSLQKETVKDLDAPAEKAGNVKGGKTTVVPGPRGSGGPEVKYRPRGLTKGSQNSPGPIH
jgi:hypothetical protein